MIYWRTGFVVEVTSERSGMQEVKVELEGGYVDKALHDMSIHPPLCEGDLVLLNTTAVQLGLGSGGYHFVHAVLSPFKQGTQSNVFEPDMPMSISSPAISRIPQGHLMKLKYTSLQRAVLSAEEENSPYHHIFVEQHDISGTPVLIGELHSMLPIAVTWLMARKPYLRIAYVMSDGGALPIAFSRHVAILKQLSWLSGTVTYGQAYGGDLETMNKFTACIAARHIFKADIIIVCMGPGIAGTGTPLGHTGIEVGELVNCVHMLGGKPIIMPRVSEVDKRQRHVGISHHVLATLQYAAVCQAVLPLSAQISASLERIMKLQLANIDGFERHETVWLKEPTVGQLQAALSKYPVPVASMGRTLYDDPSFFLNVASAAEYAIRYLDHANIPEE